MMILGSYASWIRGDGRNNGKPVNLDIWGSPDDASKFFDGASGDKSFMIEPLPNILAFKIWGAEFVEFNIEQCEYREEMSYHVHSNIELYGQDFNVISLPAQVSITKAIVESEIWHNEKHILDLEHWQDVIYSEILFQKTLAHLSGKNKA